MSTRRRLFNAAASFVHLSFFIAICAVDTPYELELTLNQYNTKEFLEDNPEFATPVCGNTTYTNVFKWFDCLNTTEGRNQTRVETEVTTYPTWRFLACFAFITGMIHACLAIWHDAYDVWITRRIAPVRWLEYSFTYTLMTIAIFTLNQQTDIYFYLLIVVSSAAQMFMGYAIEYTNMPGGSSTLDADAYIWEQQTLREKLLCSEGSPSMGTRQRLFVCVITGVSMGLLYWPLAFLALPVWIIAPHFSPRFLLHWGLYIWSSLIMGVHFYILFHSFMDAFQPYFDVDSADLYKQLYNFILILNIFILCAYSIFPIIHVWTYLDRSKKCYEKGELAYIVASMTSKVGLIAIVFAGINARDD